MHLCSYTRQEMVRFLISFRVRFRFVVQRFISEAQLEVRFISESFQTETGLTRFYLNTSGYLGVVVSALRGVSRAHDDLFRKLCKLGLCWHPPPLRTFLAEKQRNRRLKCIKVRKKFNPAVVINMYKNEQRRSFSRSTSSNYEKYLVIFILEQKRGSGKTLIWMKTM